MDVNVSVETENTMAGSNGRPYQVCTHCLLDTSEPLITFDKEGICNFCHQYFERQLPKALSESEKKQSLKRIVDEIKAQGAGKKYDCIIGLSGGVDSSYVAWMVKGLGLRPLAIHFDNGWNSELAVSNIEQICSRLDIDLFTYVVNWPEFRDLQLAFLKAGVANAEIPTDHGIFATLYRQAKKFNIKYILDGVNHATEFIRSGFTVSGWAYSDLRHLKALHKKYGTVKLDTFPTLSLYRKAWMQKVYGLKQVSILDYTDYVKKDAVELLQRELGWRPYGGKHHESVFTKWHQLVYLPVRFGFDKRRLHLSDLILSGQLTREQAIKEFNHPPATKTQLRELEEYVQKKLGLTAEDYAALLNSPPRSYKEYPNDERIMSMYKKFKGSAI
jgi:N-acetyl sugar amidotransferase